MTKIIHKNTDETLKGRTEKDVYFGYTCIGGRAEDQDCLAYNEINGRQFFAVCDGMGGHAGGCVASFTAACAIGEAFERQANVLPTSEVMVTAVSEANASVYKTAQETPSLRGMGTTLTLLVIDDEAAYVTHTGDSRIYQFRKGKKVFRTFDHSIVFEQVAKGKMTEEEARQHPRSNVLSRAIGILPDVDVVVTKLDYQKGDRFVLCCDGVWNTQPEKEIIKMFTTHQEVETACMSSRSMVEKFGNDGGGKHDNHTMIAVDMLCDSKYRKSLFGRLKKLFQRKRN